MDSQYNVVFCRKVMVSEYNTLWHHDISAYEPVVVTPTGLLTDNLTSNQRNSSEIIKSSVYRGHRRGIKTLLGP